MSVALARKERHAENLVPGEYRFTEADFRKIASLLYAQAGIVLSDSKATLVYSRLAKRLRALGLSTFAEYCDLVAAPDSVDERVAMLNSLTTNLTHFYREPHHFDHLRDKVIAPMAGKLRTGGRLRLWSAGCSTGQEAYTLALTVLSVLPQAQDLDIRILATDIDSNVLAHGRAGVYTEDLIEPIPAALRDRWMEQDEQGDWRAGQAMRRLVSFNELNLMGAWPMKGQFQAVFCRNVVIYFDEPTQEKLWGRMTRLVEPGGRLYIGHSERIMGAAAAELTSDGLTVYRKTGG
jgi:chemotaxis protein methyltransferase CheR